MTPGFWPEKLKGQNCHYMRWERLWKEKVVRKKHQELSFGHVINLRCMLDIQMEMWRRQERNELERKMYDSVSVYRCKHSDARSQSVCSI